MHLKDILALKANMPQGMRWDIAPRAMERWNPGIQAADSKSNDIGVFDVIGDDYWGEGVTAKRISGALRAIGKNNPVVVNINSPGGDLFEGLTIYSLLKEHEGDVTVKILGLAASAASIIAMAGDQVEISRAGFYMIHNTWSVFAGDRNQLRDYADYLEPFDMAMAGIYSEYTGLATAELSEMMDRETWIGGEAAIEQSFADSLLSSDEVTEGEATGERAAARKIDIAMAKAGISRKDRRQWMNEFKSSKPSAAGGGTPSAATTDTPSAVVLEAEPLLKLSI